jgi:membrane associated rhomboid family serine protease
MHREKGSYIRFISSGFVHADFGHLLLNMLTLWFFGSALEQSVFSEIQFILFYFSALVLSSLPEFQKQKNNREYKACGASGAVSAVLFSLVLFQPWGVVYIKFIIPVYFILFAVFYLLYSWYKSRKQDDNIAHGVHLWGALYGLAFTLLVLPESLHLFLNSVLHPPF